MSQALFTAAMPTAGSAVKPSATINKNMSSRTPVSIGVKKFGAVPAQSQRSAVVMSATPDKNMGSARSQAVQEVSSVLRNVGKSF